MSNLGKPLIDVKNDSVYLSILLSDGSIYNTIQVDKNKRLASSLDKVVKKAKTIVNIANPKSKLLVGYHFYWGIL